MTKTMKIKKAKMTETNSVEVKQHINGNTMILYTKKTSKEEANQ